MREQFRARLTEVWPELQILAEAKNGEEAVAAVQDHRPDLAFLDIRMPGMTGIEAARHIGDACHVVSSLRTTNTPSMRSSTVRSITF